MRNVIIGTAGHVDHGKTCLIKALTGTDTDRLLEEKRRGITIETGFAELLNEEGMKIGIVDVPGHERFVKNMLACIGGIDLVLLIIALDEGVMPQTREHFEILKMLQIKKGILVFTKCDLVDAEFAEIVEEDARELIKGSFLENAASIRVSAYTGENIEELRKMILEAVRNTSDRRNDAALFRLPADRVFMMKGFGTVVTGTLLEGSCRVGDEVMLYPQERLVRIRGLQNHNTAEEAAYAGQRTALNLPGIRKEEMERGEIVAAPGSMYVTKVVDAKVQLFDSTKRLLKNQGRVHVNFGAAQVTARVVLLSKDQLQAGEEDYAQFFFEKPVSVKFGDCFIIRFFSPVESFGGGRFLEASARKHKRKDEDVLRGLAIKDTGSKSEILEEEIRSAGASFPDRRELAKRLATTENDIEGLLEQLKKTGVILAAKDEGYVHKTYWNEIVSFTDDILSEFHKENNILDGMEKAEFANRLGHRFHIPEKTRERLIFELSKKNVLRLSDSTVALSKFTNTYSKEQERMREQILSRYRKAGIEVPTNEEIIFEFPDHRLAKQILLDLVKDGDLVKINASHCMSSPVWEKALAMAIQKLKADGSITLGEFRDILGTSRKYAVMLLEAFDQKRITKMTGDTRILVENRS